MRAISESTNGSDAVAGKSGPRGARAHTRYPAQDDVHIADQWDRKLSAGARRRLRRNGNAERDGALHHDALGYACRNGGTENRPTALPQSQAAPTPSLATS